MPIESVDDEVVIETATVVLNQKVETITLKVEDLSFAIVFKGNDGKPNFRSEIPDPDQKVMRFILENWTNQLGTGTKVKVGNLGDRDLFLSIVSHIVGDRTKNYSRLFSYTFTTRRRP